LGEFAVALADTKIDGLVATICLDNFQKRNALCGALVDEIIKALDSFAENRVRAVVLRARPGVRIWSAGHDVDELPEGHRDPLGWYDPLRRLVRAIENHPAPVIAMIEGGVWGGACEMAMACDIVIAAPNATFALTPAKLGVPYNVSGMLTFLNSASLRVVKEMAFTARPIAAERALSAGLINHMVPLDDLESFTYALAAEIIENAPLSIAVMKEELRILAGAHPMSPQGWERVQGLRRVVYDSSDYVEGIKAFKEKRKPAYRGE
jgi:methylmalonyl-CoA decarboxylase